MSVKRQQEIRKFAESLMQLGMISRRSRRSQELFGKYPFNSQQLPLLGMVALENGALVKEIAGRLLITSSAATQMIHTLIKKGLLVKTADHKDKRAVRVVLTPKTRKLLSQFHKDMIRNMEQMFKPVPDAELVRLAEVFRTILSYLQA